MTDVIDFIVYIDVVLDHAEIVCYKYISLINRLSETYNFNSQTLILVFKPFLLIQVLYPVCKLNRCPELLMVLGARLLLGY